MELNITLRELGSAQEAMQKLADIPKIPVKVRFRMGTALDTVNDELKKMGKVRNELVQEYGVEKEEGTWSVSVKDVGSAKNKEYKEKIEELLEETVQISFVPIPLSYLEQIPVEEDTLTVGDIMVMSFLFENDLE